MGAIIFITNNHRDMLDIILARIITIAFSSSPHGMLGGAHRPTL